MDKIIPIDAASRLGVYDGNSIGAFIPEIWAAESLRVLVERMVMGNLVYKNFENEIAEFGDVVNTRRPGEMQAKRKGVDDDVTTTAAAATNVQVKLNQHIYESFIIKDAEQSKSFKDLVAEYLVPCVRAVARQVDQMLAVQSYQFLTNAVGALGTAPDEDTVIALNEKLDTLKAPEELRNCVITAKSKGDLLSVTQFVEADKVGDDGTALRTGSLGSKYGINFLMSQQIPQIASGNTVIVAAVNNATGYAVGTTSIAIDGLVPATDPQIGEWCTIAGDMHPQLITGYGASSGLLTISPGLFGAVVNDAAIAIYDGGAINLLAGYADEWVKPIVVDGFTVAPKKGQLLTIGATAGSDPVYGLTGTPTTTSIFLDVPLDGAATNDELVGIGPAGSYNFCFHPEALALVSRPLALPAPGLGVTSARMSANGIGLRVTIGYNMTKQGIQVTVDLLAGTKVLNTDLGAVMLGD